MIHSRYQKYFFDRFPKTGKMIGDGADGSVYLYQDKVIKFSTLDSYKINYLSLGFNFDNVEEHYNDLFKDVSNNDSCVKVHDFSCEVAFFTEKVFLSACIMDRLDVDLELSDSLGFPYVVKNFSKSKIESYSKHVMFDKIKSFMLAYNELSFYQLDLNYTNIMFDKERNIKMIDFNRMMRK